MNKIRTLIVDDHAIMRAGLCSLLKTQADLDVVGDCNDGASAIKLTARLKPDIVIMDLLMPGMDGSETTRHIIEMSPTTNILILTSFGTADGLAHALSAGAKGAILKSAALTELLKAIHQVAKGNRYVSSDIEQILEDDPPVQQLTDRQLAILQSVTRGLTNTDIAQQMHITLPMVKEHLACIFAKIGAANRAEAVGIALKKHLLKI